MGIPSVGEKSLVFQVFDGSCMCDGCLKKIQKKLPKILGKLLSIDYDSGEEKLTIKGRNMDSNMVITTLGNLKKNVELIKEDNGTIDQIEDTQILVDQIEDLNVVDGHSTLNQIEEKKIVVHQKEVLNNEAAVVVVDKLPFNNKVVSVSALGIASHPYSKFDHEHEIEMQKYNKSFINVTTKRFTCDGCKEEGFGKRYRCKHCDYELHEDCMNPKPTISHDLFEGSVFKFSHEKPTCGIFCRVHTKSCEACGNEIHGYSYHSKNLKLYLHPRCVNFTKKLCIDGETFVLKNKGTVECFWCNGSEITANSGWSYVSEGNKEQLHVNCMAKIAHEAWKERAIGEIDDAYILVLQKRLKWGMVKNAKRNRGSRGSKLFKMIIALARTIIGILLGDPTVILASMLVEVIKK